MQSFYGYLEKSSTERSSIEKLSEEESLHKVPCMRISHILNLKWQNLKIQIFSIKKANKHSDENSFEENSRKVDDSLKHFD